MHFKTKLEAYLYTIYLLYGIKMLSNPTNEEKIHINDAINRIKIAFENHEQNLDQLICILNELRSILNSKHTNQIIVDLVASIKKCQLQIQSPQEKFENPLARRFESELSLSLLLQPTKAMMESVGRVSQQILLELQHIDESLSNGFLSTLEEEGQAIACGSFKKIPTKQEIIDLLSNNNQQKLSEIMHIHFKFAQVVSRKIPILHTPAREVVGKFKEVIGEIWKNENPTSFFTEGINQPEAKDLRAYIADVKFCKSPLYTAIPGKGRKGPLALDKRHCQFGLMLSMQNHFAVGLPISSFLDTGLQISNS